jgi:uncharacterized protein (DUF1499 family)
MSPRAKRLLAGSGGLLAAAGLVLKLISFTGDPPRRPEIVRALPGCPPSPNCVGSQNTDEARAVEPFLFSGDPAAALARISEIITQDGGRLVRADAGYLHFEYRSRLFGFVDDLECLLNAPAGRIEVRSAARSGYSDLGVNRRRVERIRAAHVAALGD